MSLTTLALAMVPMLLLVGVGVLLRRTSVLKREDSGPLNAVIVNVALPAIVFVSVAQAQLSWGLLLVAGIAWAVSLAALSVAWEIAHVLRLEPKTTGAFVLVAALGNTSYFGYPVVRAILGQAAMPSAVFYDVFGTYVVMFSLGIAVAARHGEHEGKINVLKELLTFPAIIALAVALLYRLLPLPVGVSNVVMSWIGMAASMTVPLIMVSIGVSLDFSSITGSVPALGAATVIKLLVMPALAAAIVTLTKDASSMRLVVLQAGMPSMMLSLVIGQRFKLDTSFIASAILVTTAVSLITIPVAQVLLP